MAIVNKAINVKEFYKASNDSIHTGLAIKLKPDIEVYIIFDHEQESPYLISIKEVLTKLRDLADHIEKHHA